MNFRFTLSHLSGEQIISEPDGWADIKLTLERSAEYWSLSEKFDVPLLFYGSNGVEDGGKDFIENVEQNYGVDEIVTITIAVQVDSEEWELVFEGMLDLSTLEEVDERKLSVAIVQSDLITKFKNREDTPVDLRSTEDLDGNAVTPATIFTDNLPAQIINQNSQYTGHSGDINTIQEVFAATTANITLSGTQTIDGVPLIVGRRVLVKDQTLQPDNGVYIVAAGSWTRASDANTDFEMENGIVSVQFGTVNAGKVFKQTTTPVTLGTSNLVWVEYNYVDDYLLYNYADDGTVDVCSQDIADIYFSATVDPIIKEIQNTYMIPVFAVLDPVDIGPQIEIEEGYGSLTISGTITVSYEWDVNSNSGGPIEGTENRLSWYYQINDDTPVHITTNIITLTGPPYTQPYEQTVTYSETIAVNLGDRVKTYIRLNIIPDWDECTGDYFQRIIYGGIVSSEVNFDLESEADPTAAEGFLVHDVAGAIIDRITQPDRFYSSYFGSAVTSYRTYTESGCGWSYILHKGLHIRGYTLAEKKFFMSFKEWWNGINPIFNIGLTYEEIDGVLMIRVEDKAYFFDPDPSLILYNVNNPQRSYDKEYIFKKITVGYNKWQAEEVRGIDDPQTKKTYATRFTTVGKEISIVSDFIAASLNIESTRRKTISRSSDYKFDNDTYIIAVNDQSAYDTEVEPRTDLNDDYFTSITNLVNSDTRYNLILTPGRNFARWYEFFNGCLQSYLDSVYRFTSGEGNYDLVTNANDSVTCPGMAEFPAFAGDFSESQDIAPSEDYLFSPIIYEFEHPLTWEDYKTIRDNKTKAIGVSTTDTAPDTCFIKSLVYDINKSLGKFVVWKK